MGSRWGTGRVEAFIGFYVGFTLLALAGPRAAACGYLLVAVVGVLRARGD